MGDDFLMSLDDAIYNWHLAKNFEPMESVFNALKNAVVNNVEVLVPVNDQNETAGIALVSNGEDNLIPLFTSEEEMSLHMPGAVARICLSKVFEGFLADEKIHAVAINPFGNRFVVTRNILSALNLYEPRSRINIITGGVLAPRCKVIVNAANERLLGGGGVDGAIHKAAGPDLLEECRKLNGCKTGDAKITGAYNIKHAKKIIHTVGPVYGMFDNPAELLSSCYRKSLDLAFENGLDSIAFPCISTGVYRYPLDEAAEVCLKTVSQWLDCHKEFVMNVYICCFNESEYESYARLLGK